MLLACSVCVCVCVKCIALWGKQYESDCFFPLHRDLPKVWVSTNTPQKFFFLPAAQKACMLPPAKPLSLQFLLPSAGSRFSNAHLKHLRSICQQGMLLNWQKCHQWNSQCNARGPLYPPVTHNHRHRFSMRVHCSVKMAMLPLISKGIERWQGHSRSIGVLKLALCRWWALILQAVTG